ncbi:hypothetical protein ACP4OV_006350 [Aristida adscensionis]
MEYQYKPVISFQNMPYFKKPVKYYDDEEEEEEEKEAEEGQEEDVSEEEEDSEEDEDIEDNGEILKRLRVEEKISPCVEQLQVPHESEHECKKPRLAGGPGSQGEEAKD